MFYLKNINQVVLPNFLLGKKSVPFLFQEKCNSFNISHLLIEFIGDIDNKKKLFRKYSKLILSDMNYNKSKKIDFSTNSSKEIIKIINNYNY